MATQIIKTIGTSARDYSTNQLAEDAITANLVTADEQWEMQTFNDSEFVGASGATVLTISGHTTDSTRYIHWTTGAGQSFQDNAGVRTNALYYSQANGVGIRSTGSYNRVIDVLDGFCRITKLQIQSADDSQAKGIFNNGEDSTYIKDCIIHAREVCSMTIAPTNSTYVNCLLVMRGAGKIIGIGGGSGNRFEFCTIIGSGGSSTPGSIGYATLTVENCAIFNFATGFTTTTGGTLAGGYNCTDLASAPGSNNQVSKTFANQFENTSTDFRAKTGGDLANGTPATSYATADISNTSRSATTPYIGAWELSAGGGSPAPSIISDIILFN